MKTELIKELILNDYPNTEIEIHQENGGFFIECVNPIFNGDYVYENKKQIYNKLSKQFPDISLLVVDLYSKKEFWNTIRLISIKPNFYEPNPFTAGDAFVGITDLTVYRFRFELREKEKEICFCCRDLPEECGRVSLFKIKPNAVFHGLSFRYKTYIGVLNAVWNEKQECYEVSGKLELFFDECV